MTNAHDLINGAASALKERIEEVNRLNVFPVPDGDTGTNMSLTMDAVVKELSQLAADAGIPEVCHAVTRGSLMGARGNSGVILSQVLRGMCEGLTGVETLDSAALAAAMERSAAVAYQAVRKPVEGTMLTVVKDAAVAATRAAESGMALPDALVAVTDEAFESVKRTPELLEVLRANGVVDAGAFGLAILMEGFTAAARGERVVVADVSSDVAPMLQVTPVDDWDDDEYLYCTEFLLFGEAFERDRVHDYVSAMGGSELVVGDAGELKVHVHTNDPGTVLAHFTSLGEVAEVHVNNMRRQQASRDSALRQDAAGPAQPEPPKPIGFVAVAAGQGLSDILRSLGVDEVVSGGQTMNPSTADLAEAASRVNAERIVFLPNNKNIIMAANAAASIASVPAAVVPTRSVPEAFSAMLSYDGGDDLDATVAAMTEAASSVRTGEVTTAVKDATGKAGPIAEGQAIGITGGEIEVVGDDVYQVAVDLAAILADGAETITVLAGADLDDAGLAAVVERIRQAHPDIEIESLRGEQPLYPILISAE